MPLAPLVLAGLALADPAAPPEPVAAPSEPAPAAPDEPRLPVRVHGDQEVEFAEPSEDVFGFGQRVIAAARVADNAFLIGQEVRVNAPVAGDVFAGAETVRISAPVGGDVYSTAAEVLIEDGGSVGGNLYAGAGELRIEGPVDGDVAGGAGLAVLGAPIGGDVDLEVGELRIRDGASVAGVLSYAAPRPADGVDALNATDVRFTQKQDEASEAEDTEAAAERGSLLGRIARWWTWTLWAYGSKLLVGFAFLAVGGRAAGRVAHALLEEPGRAFGLGFVVACVVPVASLVAMALVVPLPLGVLALLGLAVAMYAAQLLTAQAVGDLILRRFRPEALGSPFVSMAVGLAPLVLVIRLPWLGTVAWLAASIGGIGALWLSTRRAATSA